MKITVKHYVEITSDTQLTAIVPKGSYFITNEGGKQYLVELWK